MFLAVIFEVLNYLFLGRNYLTATRVRLNIGIKGVKL